jgi:LysM repeat protein
MKGEVDVAPRSAKRSRRVVLTFAGAALVAAGCGGSKHAAKATTLPTAPTIPSTTTTPPNTYVVRAGDSLGLIAKRLNVALNAIIALNHLPDANKISVGQVLVVPPTTTTTVPRTTVAPTTVPAPGAPTTGAASGNLTISPASGRAGTTFTLKVTGAKPTETVTFEVDAPNGKKFTGPPHPVGADGSVSASYFTQQVDPPGSYNVIAIGNQGTSAQASFRVDPPNQ